MSGFAIKRNGRANERIDDKAIKGVKALWEAPRFA